MSKQSLFMLAADATLVLHVMYVMFVVLGLFIIYVGYFANWSWVRNRWFRILHLCAIALVVLQTWVGVMCPLTILEMALREKAGVTTYSGSFIQHWLQSLLYYDLPDWVFVLCYSAFGGLVLVSWFIVKPNRFASKH